MSTPSSPLQISILNQIPTSTEVIQTLKSLQRITQINIESPQFKSSLKNFSQQHMTLYKSHTTQQGQTHYVCFVQQQREGDLYLNQLTAESFRVQLLEGLVLERKEHQKAKLSEQHLNSLKMLYSMLQSYLERHFSGPYGVTCHFKLNADKIEEIIIGLTNKYTNSTNFSTGEWTSYWSFKSTQYSAKINTRNHFNEGGNISFQRPKSIQKTLPVQQNLSFTSLTEHAIHRIVTIIQKEQKEYQKQLQNIYSQKLSQSLKKLRRISPLTQGKMIWNVNAVLLSEGLHEKLPNLS